MLISKDLFAYCELIHTFIKLNLKLNLLQSICDRKFKGNCFEISGIDIKEATFLLNSLHRNSNIFHFDKLKTDSSQHRDIVKNKKWSSKQFPDNFPLSAKVIDFPQRF